MTANTHTTNTKKKMPDPEDTFCKRSRPLRLLRNLSEPVINEYLEAAWQPTTKVVKEVPVFEYHTEELRTLPLKEGYHVGLVRLPRSLSEPTLIEHLEAARQPITRVVKKVSVFEFHTDTDEPTSEN
jgi:hypothetical protein